MIGSVLGLALFFLKSIHNLVPWLARPYALCSKGALVASYHNLSLSKDWRDPLWPINASPNSKVVLFVGHCVWRNGEGGGSIVPLLLLSSICMINIIWSISSPGVMIIYQDRLCEKLWKSNLWVSVFVLFRFRVFWKLLILHFEALISPDYQEAIKKCEY